MLGGGAWEGGCSPGSSRPSTWDEGHGVARYFRFNTDHKVIGLQYVWSAIFAFGVAGLLAMLMRIELMSPSLSLFATSMD